MCFLFYLATAFWLGFIALVRRSLLTAPAVEFRPCDGHAEKDLRELVQLGRLPGHRLDSVVAFSRPPAALLSGHDSSPVRGSSPA